MKKSASKIKSKSTGDFYPESDSDSDSEANDDCSKNFWSWQPKRDLIGFQCLRESFFHGLKYIGEQNASLIQRLFWFFSVLAACIFSFHLINVAVIKPLLANPVLISFDSGDITIDQIPFPAVTICNGNKLKSSGLKPLQARVQWFYNEVDAGRINISDTSNRTGWPEREYLALIYLNNYCTTSRSFQEAFNDHRFYFQEGYTTVDEYHEAFEAIVEYLYPAFNNCEEMILLCLWDDQPVACNKLFNDVFTEYGICCEFNSIPRFLLNKYDQNLGSQFEQNLSAEEIDSWERFDIDCDLVAGDSPGKDGYCNSRKKVKETGVERPIRQRRSGMMSGLTVLLNPQLQEYFDDCKNQDSEGFRVEVHSPLDFSHVADFGKTIKPNSETFLKVQPHVTTVEDDTIKETPSKKRNCFFTFESPLRHFSKYTQQNCEDECMANLTRSRCHCLLYHMPKWDNAPMCRIKKDFDCITTLHRNITDGLISGKGCGDCLPSCQEIQYTADTTSLPLRDDVKLWSTRNDSQKNTFSSEDKLSILHVFFETETVEARLRRNLYGIEEIIGKAGGLLGLMLGFSAISIADPVYFLILKVSKKIVGKLRHFRQQKVSNETIIINKDKKRFSPLDFLVNPNDFMRWADPYSTDPKNRPTLIPFPRDFIRGRIK